LVEPIYYGVPFLGAPFLFCSNFAYIAAKKYKAMINYKIKVNDEVTTIAFPTSYHDLTYGQFLRLRFENTKDIGVVLEILTGMSRSIWMNLGISEYDKVIKFLNWLIESPIKWDELPMPEKLTIGGKSYLVPKDLGLKTFGQKIVLESRITEIITNIFGSTDKKNISNDIKSNVLIKSQNSLISVIPFTVAVYMQPEVTGTQFDESLVPSVEHQILDARAVEVYPIGNFFIRSLLGSAKSGQTPLKVTNQKVSPVKSKRKQVLKKSKKRKGTS
jgi:hypothetical protein